MHSCTNVDRERGLENENVNRNHPNNTYLGKGLREIVRVLAALHVLFAITLIQHFISKVGRIRPFDRLCFFPLSPNNGLDRSQ